jgi:hypothetical protein
MTRCANFPLGRMPIRLSDPEHVVLLATSLRRLGRTRHVELLLLLGDIGQDGAQVLVLDKRGLVYLQPFVEGAVGRSTALYRIASRPSG